MSKNLVEIWRYWAGRDGKHFAKSRVRSQIRSQLFQSKNHRYEGRPNVPYLSACNRLFGKQMAQCVADRNASSALYLINNQPHVARRAWHDFMNEKFSKDVFQCEDCNKLFFIGESIECYHQYLVCGDCADGYRYCSNRDTYVREEDFDQYAINSYHSSKRLLGHIPSLFDQRKPRVLLGLELEIEVDRNKSREDIARHLLINVGNFEGERYALCEEDRSIRHGFEMVTAYTGLDVHAEQLQFFKKIFKGAKSHQTTTCGLHVHICKSDMTTLHGAKMILFINDQANRELIKAIARRDGSSYASLKNKKQDKGWIKESLNTYSDRQGRMVKVSDKFNQLKRLNNDRYEALNFKNDKTIEFRLFRGSLKYTTIMACLEFTYATWFFCRDASSNALTTDNFLKFICADQNKGDTKFLREFLESKGFKLPVSNVINLKKVA